MLRLVTNNPRFQWLTEQSFILTAQQVFTHISYSLLWPGLRGCSCPGHVLSMKGRGLRRQAKLHKHIRDLCTAPTLACPWPCPQQLAGSPLCLPLDPGKGLAVHFCYRGVKNRDQEVSPLGGWGKSVESGSGTRGAVEIRGLIKASSWQLDALFSLLFPPPE